MIRNLEWLEDECLGELTKAPSIRGVKNLPKEDVLLLAWDGQTKIVTKDNLNSFDSTTKFFVVETKKVGRLN